MEIRVNDSKSGSMNKSNTKNTINSYSYKNENKY